ncbi:alkaline phosphatase family protein [Halosimplex sp. J119]
MVGASKLKTAVQNPHLALLELNGFLDRRFRPKSYNKSGIDIFEEDWDNLIILDACRFDEFERLSDLPGTLGSRESRAGTTRSFIEGNFEGRELHDTVYVTGNSWVFKKGADSNFHLVYDVVEHPSEEGGKDKPTLIMECAKEAAEKHPNKRLIVHFIRPHHPFLGETAQQLFNGREDQPSSLYNQIWSSEVDISDETLETLYRENLELVLPKVEELMNTFRGKTVVSADHGELLGDRVGPLKMKAYGHHRGIHVEELTKVPWLEYQTGERREIKSDDPIPEPDRSFSMGAKSVDDRLRDLGYKV